MENIITLQLEGTEQEQGHITLSAFLSQLEAVKAALKQTERLLTGEEESSVYYRIIDLRHSSPATVVLEAVSFSTRPGQLKKRKHVQKDDYSQPTVKHFFHSLKEIREKKRSPEKADLQVLQAYRNLAASLEKDVSRIKLVNKNESVDIDKTFQTAIDQIIGPDELFAGTICGTLEKLNLHNTTRFDIFPTIGPKQVACDFKLELKDDVIRAVDKYVCVTGTLRYKRLGNFPYAVDADKIEILPPEHELPTLFDIRGMAPDLTRGQTISDFLEEVRDAQTD